MEQFFVFRQARVGEESSAGAAVPEGAGEQETLLEAQTETSSKLGALLVVLAPFAIAVWVVIGLSVYRLLT
jgi:hypothetical protein